MSVILASLGFNTGDLLNQLESLGFFQYLLPFLLIFAVTYAILTKIPVFKDNKGAGVLVAVAIGLLSLQLDYVPAFFQTIFPKFGVGLAFLLIALILAGVFISGDDNHYKWIFFGLGTLVFLIITFSSFYDWSFVGSYWFERYGGLAISLGVVILGVILVIAFGKGH